MQPAATAPRPRGRPAARRTAPGGWRRGLLAAVALAALTGCRGWIPWFPSDDAPPAPQPDAAAETVGDPTPAPDPATARSPAAVPEGAARARAEDPLDPAARPPAAPAPDRPPAGPMPLMDLPPEHYVVQLLALDSKEALEEYALDKQLRGMSAARVERDGRLYYILLLGVYPTLERAEAAAADLPPAVSGLQPWVRRMGSLQRAIMRGDALAGTSEI